MIGDSNLTTGDYEQSATLRNQEGYSRKRFDSADRSTERCIMCQQIRHSVSTFHPCAIKRDRHDDFSHSSAGRFLSALWRSRTDAIRISALAIITRLPPLAPPRPTIAPTSRVPLLARFLRVPSPEQLSHITLSLAQVLPDSDNFVSADAQSVQWTTDSSPLVTLTTARRTILRSRVMTSGMPDSICQSFSGNENQFTGERDYERL